VIVGVDPSWGHGGVAVLRNTGHVELFKMPPDKDRVTTFFRELLEYNVAPLVVLEEIPLFTGQARSAARMMPLYGNANFVEGYCRGMGYEVQTLRPQAWQKAAGVARPKGMAQPAWKNHLKEHARSLFPDLHITGATADALLIAAAAQKIFSL
jgi:hypothetical protein